MIVATVVGEWNRLTVVRRAASIYSLEGVACFAGTRGVMFLERTISAITSTARSIVRGVGRSATRATARLACFVVISSISALETVSHTFSFDGRVVSTNGTGCLRSTASWAVMTYRTLVAKLGGWIGGVFRISAA